MSKELDHPKKGLTNIQNTVDSERFQWCLVRYLYPADHNPRRIRKVDKDFAGELDFKGIKFPVKIREIFKIEKLSSISISVFGFESKQNTQSIC